MNQAIKKWIPKKLHKGALHRQLGVPKSSLIPRELIAAILNTKTGNRLKNPTSVGRRSFTVTKLLKERARFAFEARGFNHHV